MEEYVVWIEEREGKNNMKYSIEENLLYAWLAMIVLAVFYAIYFGGIIRMCEQVAAFGNTLILYSA